MEKIINKETCKEFYQKIDHSLFASIHSSRGEAVASLLNSNNLDEKTINEFIEKASSYLNEDKGNLTLKIVGRSDLINKFSKQNNEIDLLEVKKVVRDGNFEVIFIPETGLLRATKEAAPTKKAGKTKILIVDDSKTIVNLLTKIFKSESSFEVVATAEKPSLVEDLIKKHKPDVITLDIHMPEMNGVELLKTVIAPKYNIPTIMVTSISIEEGPMVLDALENGAFDYIQKPELSELAEVAPILVEKVKEASKVNVKKEGTKTGYRICKSAGLCETDSLVVIGSSTGGTNALKEILTAMPKEIPPVLIVQHIPAVFSKAFADRINTLCPFLVKEATDGEVVAKNTVYVAPGGQQMKVLKKGAELYIQITDDAPVNRFKPSVDYLFDSVVSITSKKHVVGVILTGMGKDGAKGLKKLRDAGALTIAQNEESSVVFGMPREAIALGAAVDITHKDDIAARISEYSHPDFKTQGKAG